ncbi:MAG: 50S ribosomal protein L32e [Candidatus Micrarchaeota archaeon]|nr:50S ribosomal protein L32e [Candidatus Micrarchaeota archaeon]
MIVKPKKLRLMKKKHPRFKRPNVGRTKRSRLEDKWRKPRGIDNKQRSHRIPAGALPNVGFKNTPKIRGIHPSGYREVLVRCLGDLLKLNPNDGVAIRISASIGKKKREMIVKKADELKLKVLN